MKEREEGGKGRAALMKLNVFTSTSPLRAASNAASLTMLARSAPTKPGVREATRSQIRCTSSSQKTLLLIRKTIQVLCLYPLKIEKKK